VTDSPSLLDIANQAYTHEAVIKRSSKDSWFRFIFKYCDCVHIIRNEKGLVSLFFAERIDAAAVHIYFLLTFTEDGFFQTVKRVRELWPAVTHVRYVRRNKQRFANLLKVEQLVNSKGNIYGRQLV
jgi:hypothetical protein